MNNKLLVSILANLAFFIFSAGIFIFVSMTITKVSGCAALTEENASLTGDALKKAISSVCPAVREYKSINPAPTFALLLTGMSAVLATSVSTYLGVSLNTTPKTLQQNAVNIGGGNFKWGLSLMIIVIIYCTALAYSLFGAVYSEYISSKVGYEIQIAPYLYGLATTSIGFLVGSFSVFMTSILKEG